MQKKKMRNVTVSSIWCSVIALVLALLLVLNNTAMTFATIISTALGQPMSKMVEIEGSEQTDSDYFTADYTADEAHKVATDLSREIAAEGMVLLKNDESTLPLGQNKRISLFSESTVEMLYSGSGSGQISTTSVPTLKDAFEQAGYTVNDTLWDFYQGNHDKFTRERMSWNPFENSQGVYRINECPASEYTDAVKASYPDYNDAAVFVFARSGGESNDLNLSSPETDNGSMLSLTREEASVLQMLQDDPSFDTIIVLVNAGNMPELGWMDNYSKIKACLWIGYPGPVGLYAVADMFTGDVNPSGHLPDTIAYDPSAAPAALNTDDNTYTNSSEIEALYGSFNVPSEYHYQNKYVAYQEGIYIGYRYYETRYEDVVLGQGNAGNYDYAATVQYPFGYGLSYTSFDQSDFSVKQEGGNYVLTTTVTNTGNVAGKEVVQAYLQKPYTDYDKENGIEKASVELAGFEKTKLLAPGESETITITVTEEQLKSYDANKAKTYIIDEGDYYFTIADNAHDALNNILAAKGKTVADGMTADGDAAMTASFHHGFDDKTYSVSDTTGEKITNQFDFASLNNYWSDITYMSRSDWEGTYPTHLQLTAPEQLIADLDTESTYLQENPDDEMPTQGNNTGIQLISLRGADFDDEQWNTFLDQLTVDEMFNIIQLGGWRIVETPSVGNPGAVDQDGPQGVSGSIGGIFGGEGGTACTAYPSSIVLAATFNRDLASKMGTMVGEEALYAGVSGWYAPAMNMHRNAFGGRNFEYYSEDPYLSGCVATEQVIGAQSKGMYCYIKHFALNDQETNRHSYSSFANEQTIREIYLPAFEMAVEKGGAHAVMSSYQRIGAYWTGACGALLNNVLRGEWGFDGVVLTDSANIGYANMHILSGIGNGNDMWLNTNADNYIIKDMAKRPTLVKAMRNAVHRVLYMVVNSSAMNGISQHSRVVAVTPAWINWMHIADAVVVALCGVGFVLIALRARKNKEENAKKPVQAAFVIILTLCVFAGSYAVFSRIAYLAAQSF